VGCVPPRHPSGAGATFRTSVHKHFRITKKGLIILETILQLFAVTFRHIVEQLIPEWLLAVDSSYKREDTVPPPKDAIGF
jgi:hypothetical protein